MKKFSKTFSVLLAAVMICGLTGCGGSGKTGAPLNAQESELFVSPPPSSSSDTGQHGSGQHDSSQPVESTVSEPIDFEMDGQTFSLPCKVGDLKNITIDRGFPFSVKKRDNGTYMSTSQFDYDGTHAGTIYLDGDCSGIADLSEVTVIGIVAGDSRVPVSYLGLTFDSTKDDIIRVLGDPVETDGAYLYYLIEPEGSVTFSMDSENKVVDIAVFLNIR